MRALLVSTYELGRQPFGLASPAAWLRREGWDVDCVDAARQRLDAATTASADLIGVHLPMHTATRMAGPLIRQARQINPSARICAYGLYAPLNATWLLSIGVDEVLGGEFEADLAQLARQLQTGDAGPVSRKGEPLARLQFLIPHRQGLPPLSRYAKLHMPDGTARVVGSTEASRGCKHLCRHCPVVPVYEGQFRVIQADVVLADISAQVAAGAEHITFGDPDFFNGPTHAMRIVDAMHAAHPHLTFDVTIKIEHLLRHRDLLPRLAASGCAFVTSAVESLDDRVLEYLDKGHTRAGFVRAVEACRAAGLTLVPTFVAFHPWTTVDGYCELLDTIASLDLVDHVPPIQLAIRLLVPQGSRLLELTELRDHLGAFAASTLSYPWIHRDARVDELHRDVTSLVGTRVAASRRSVFDEIRALACERAGLSCPKPVEKGGTTVPYLDEPWYCCAEPNPEEVRLI
ncbi:MAG TPA: CUAEP/CCAEP-tail radical SAM protein [Vicinamibacterales bacterium]|nr:CUAEP/CCAEP-tail radical SAM protein [Vicinamibacterales bacterium]